MRVLLVEPAYRRRCHKSAEKDLIQAQSRPNDNTLWYPPLGLMKLSRFHKDRRDYVRFVNGCDPSVFARGDSSSSGDLWDRVYITTVFTFHFDLIVKTIKFYLDAARGGVSKVFVGGIMASLMAKDIQKETGVYPVIGVLNSARRIGLPCDVNIDLLPPDYELVSGDLYAINDTYYAYTTRGCKNKCPWCGVPRIEPSFVPYINIKPVISALRGAHGDKATLKLMDNNVLASPHLERIVDDLLQLGYGRGQFTQTRPKRQRIVDFNQGLDATHLTEEKMRLLASLNIRPMRIAFDRVTEKRDYIRALCLAKKYGVALFSNYTLYNFNDTPRDLYERLFVNIQLNEQWVARSPGRLAGKIYSYPMRFAPIADMDGNGGNRNREATSRRQGKCRNWLTEPVWTRRFTRNIAVMSGAAHGAISPTPTLAKRTIGETFEEFVANLYMPEELLRNRNKHEKRIYPNEPRRKAGTGKVEEFRTFVLGLLKKQDERFRVFHDAVSPNSAAAIRECLSDLRDSELKKWLKLYLKRR